MLYRYTALTTGFLVVIGQFLLSCTKVEYSYHTQWETSIDQAIVEEAFQDIFKITDEILQTDSRFKSTCYQILKPEEAARKGTSIRFSSACSTTDGRVRAGVLRMFYNAEWRKLGTVVEVELENYTINDYQVFGKMHIINLGENADGNLKYQVSVLDGEIITPEGHTLKWNSRRMYELVYGRTTSYDTHGLVGVRDDLFFITGEATGVNRNGAEYSAPITEPLRKNMDCNWLSGGRVEVTFSGASFFSTNYGTNYCDGKATVSSSESAVKIDLLK